MISNICGREEGCEDEILNVILVTNVIFAPDYRVPPFRVDDGYSSSHRDRSPPVHGGGGGGGGEEENSSTRDQLLESELEKFERRFRLSDVKEEQTAESTT
jgi:hypothetical protein